MNKDEKVICKTLKLKYFYLIDTDKMLEKLHSSDEYANFSFASANEMQIKLLFNKIFEVIWEFSSEYNNFLDPMTIMSSSFFCEENRDLFPPLASLLKLSLRSHCIIHGFFNSFSDNTLISISAPNDKFNSAGYFETLGKYKTVEFKIESPSTIYQMYHNYYNRLDENTYSYSLLKLLDKNETNPKTFALPEHLKNWGCFMIKNPNIRTINRNLDKKNKCILVNYINLYNEYMLDQEKLTTPTDKLLLDAPMQYFYGFSTIKSLIPLLDRIYNITPENSASLNNLEGKILKDTMSAFPYCHLIYSRSLFLKYACLAVTDSPSSYSRYLDSNPNIIAFRTNLPQENRIEYAPIRISNFLKFVSNITVPILESLWDVCINDLLNTLTNDILPQIYQKYIDRNYDIMTNDFCHLSYEEIMSCYHQNNIKFSKIDETIGPFFSPDILCNILSDSTNSDFIFPKEPYVSKIISQILYSSLNIDIFKKKKDFVEDIIDKDNQQDFANSFKANHIRSICDIFMK